MTRGKTLTCIHEPFGDAFYFGPERLGTRYENDEKARQESGFAQSTYQTILDRIDNESEEVRYLLTFLFYHKPTCGDMRLRAFLKTTADVPVDEIVDAPVAGFSPNYRSRIPFMKTTHFTARSSTTASDTIEHRLM